MRARLASMIYAVLIVGLAACSGSKLTTPAVRGDRVACDAPAPLIIPDVAAEDLLPGQYIVVYRDVVGDADSLTTALSEEFGFSVSTRDRWSGAGLRGFAAALPDSTVNALRCVPEVQYVEQQSVVHSG